MPRNPESKKSAKSKNTALWELVQTVIWAVVIALLVRSFLVEGFYIPSGSMKPTLVPGERVLVAKFYYRFTEPQRGDVVVFRFKHKNLIKRIAGLPGDRMKIENGMIFVNGSPLQEERFHRTYYGVGAYGQGENTVPEGSYFVLGDNSQNSDDSRFWGYVPRSSLLGKAFLIYWPPLSAGIIR